MEQVLTQLLDAVSAALKQEPYTKPIEQDKTFYLMAKENGFSGMLYETLDRTTCSKPVQSRLTRDFFSYQAQDAKQQVAIDDTTNHLKQQDINHVFLKGSRLKALYPQPYMRAMGDIDILIEPKNRKPIYDILTSSGYTSTHKSLQHDVFRHPNGSTLEVHTQLMRARPGSNIPNTHSDWDHVEPLHPPTYRLTPAYETVYLVHHAAKHMYGSGIGLRTVLDIGLFLNAYRDVIEETELRQWMDDHDLTRFFQTILCLNHRYFGINPYPHLWPPDWLDDDVYDALTKHIVQSGIHGLGTGFNNYIGRVATHRLRHKSNILLLLSLVFPSYQAMRGMYPWLSILPILLPFAWGWRIFKLIVLNTGRTTMRLKQLHIKTDTVDQAADLYRAIGL